MVVALVPLLVRQMDRPIDRHPVPVRDGARPPNDQLFALLRGHLGRQRDLNFAGDPRILAPLRRLRRVPQFLPRPIGPATLGHCDAARDDPIAPRVVLHLAGAYVVELLARAVGRRGDGALAGTTADVPARIHAELRP
jgi:hypothetical protein